MASVELCVMYSDMFQLGLSSPRTSESCRDDITCVRVEPAAVGKVATKKRMEERTTNILVDLTKARDVVDVRGGFGKRARSSGGVCGRHGREGVRDAAVRVALGPHVRPLARVQLRCDVHRAWCHRDNDGDADPSEHRCVCVCHLQCGHTRVAVWRRRNKPPKMAQKSFCRVVPIAPWKKPIASFTRSGFCFWNLRRKKGEERNDEG